MKLTININPEDILAITHADDGRAVISMSIGNTVEMHLTVEEQADDLIDMLMAKDDKIEVGDIVERYLDDKLDSAGIYLGEDGDYWNCLFWTGAVFSTFAYPKNQFKKTGRHFDIASILEDMRK